MIKDILEINFPEYATLSTATATLTNMGDKTITTQVRIDGSIVPDFSYDWEIEFRGERYIQPLREPQASKGNDSISSVIDLTFYHKGIYDLKRYFFVSVPNVESGVAMADDYVVPLQLNLKEFVVYLNKVFDVYSQQYKGAYKAYLHSGINVEETDKKTIDINYTKIWDVITQIYKKFGVSWDIVENAQGDDLRTYDIRIGYPSVEISHVFEYGFEGGLLKFERQVQNAEIANVVFGRGSSDNMPYRYFKDKDPNNPSFPADPDWIPELANVYFANLRGKTFRDYVQGWKTNPNRQLGEGIEIEDYDELRGNSNEGWAYKLGHEDKIFNPIEYVEDKESIAKYGEIQKGLAHNDGIKPSIQGASNDLRGRLDQVVDVEEILVDEDIEDSNIENKILEINDSFSVDTKSEQSQYQYQFKTKVYAVPLGYNGSFIKDVSITATENTVCREYKLYRYNSSDLFEDEIIYDNILTLNNKLIVEIDSIQVIDNNTQKVIDDLVNIKGGTEFYINGNIILKGFLESYENKTEIPGATFFYVEGRRLYEKTKIMSGISWQLDYTPIHGQILGNYESGTIRKSQSKTISANGTSQVVFTTEQFTISEENAPATSVDMPYRITSSLEGAMYDSQPNVVAINVESGKPMTSLNLPAGTYYLENSIEINNYADQQQTFKVELLPTYIYYSYESTSRKPTFDIWVKNIWNTYRKQTPLENHPNVVVLEQPSAYEHRIWDAILGNHLGNEAKVVFSSGRLSGYSDWEFVIANTPKYDTSKTIDGMSSEWRITLYKSDAEVDATGKYIPSIMTQASAGDYFFFTGIEFPHQYVLWAEEKLDEYKQKELRKVSEVSPTIVIHTDKVRINEQDEIANALNIGYKINTKDVRFLPNGLELILQSITYTWDANTILYPNVEIVLSNDVPKNKFIIRDIVNDVSKLDGDLTLLSTQTNSEFKSSKEATTKRFNKTNDKIRAVNKRVTDLEKNSGVLDLTELTTAVGKNTSQIESISTIKVITPTI